MGDLKPLTEPALSESIVSYRGRATANGAGDGSTVVDTDLTEANDYWNDMTLLILSGASDGQSRDITDFAGGTLTVSPVFSNQILAGVRYLILPIKPSFAEIADLDVLIDAIIADIGVFPTANYATLAAYVEDIRTRLTAIIADSGELQTDWADGGRLDLLIDAIKARTDNFVGEAIDEDTTTKNWNTAVDSPDGAGGIVVTVGSAATKKKIHALLLDVSALTDTAVIYVKLFMKINGVQQNVYNTDFTIGTDPDGLWIIGDTLGIHDVLTVAVYSDTNESKAIGYTIMTEAV